MSVCSIVNCERKVFAKSMCSTHYKAQWRPPEYRVWDSMKQRCSNPNNKKYHLYGGRGIRVCERWLDFSNFTKDMGRRPEGATIDRIDPDGDYGPGNCRWATYSEQNYNLRLRSDNTTGHKGVYLDKRRTHTKPWTSCIYVNGRKIAGPYRATKEEAVRDREEAMINAGIVSVPARLHS